MRFRILKFKPASAGRGRAGARAGGDRAAAARSPPSPTTTASSGRASRSASCASSAATAAGACGTRPARCARPATGSTRLRARAGTRHASTASSYAHHPPVPPFDVPEPDRAGRARRGHAHRLEPGRRRARAGADRHAGRGRVRRGRAGARCCRASGRRRRRESALDFSLSEEQEAIRDLARKILSERCSDERSPQLERSGDWFDEALWAELVKANLAGLALPEDVGGSGFGMLEVALVLEEAGRHLAPVPLLRVARARRRCRSPLRERGAAPALAACRRPARALVLTRRAGRDRERRPRARRASTRAPRRRAAGASTA